MWHHLWKLSANFEPQKIIACILLRRFTCMHNKLFWCFFIIQSSYSLNVLKFQCHKQVCFYFSRKGVYTLWRKCTFMNSACCLLWFSFHFFSHKTWSVRVFLVNNVDRKNRLQNVALNNSVSRDFGKVMRDAPPAGRS